MEVRVELKSLNDQTNGKLRRMAHLLSGRCKVSVSFPTFIGFIYALAHAGTGPFTTVYPVAGQLAYVNGSSTATTLTIAQQLAWENQSRINIPFTMQCTVAMPREQSFMAQVKGLGLSAFQSHIITFTESRQLTLPATPSGVVVADDGGIIGTGL
jgi:hypothetical protein